MKNDALFNESHSATYCPEDDKLRLYVGRVPRDEYEALRAEGWTSTPKQDCDFVATWTPDREDTALSYAGEIDDEDTPPTERAADRAERFSGYRDKRLEEATSYADRYDAGPSVHGYQNKARAIRAADRHDRFAGRALSQWDKAEYWQSRTKGVIAHALYLSGTSVRMGRIKTLEADLRKAEKDWKEATERQQAVFDSVLSVKEHAEGTREKVHAYAVADFRWTLEKIKQADETLEDTPASPEQIRRAILASTLSGWQHTGSVRALATEAKNGTRPALEIAQEWLAEHTRPKDWNPETGSRYTRHLKLRLAYEMQMLEAQGGRLASTEIEKGGTVGGSVVYKVNKSPKTGRVVSVLAIVPAIGERWVYGVTNCPGTPYALKQIATERLAPGAYQPPTPESLAELARFEDATKARRETVKASTAPCPLVNPTTEDAERMQAEWNARALAKFEARHGAQARFYTPPEVKTVAFMTQAQYSEISRGTYASAETAEIAGGCRVRTGGGYMRRPEFPAVCKIRICSGRVVVLTDKPQKPLPVSVWVDPLPAERERLKGRMAELVAILARPWTSDMSDGEKELWNDARRAGVVYMESMSQRGFTETGITMAREAGAISPQATL